MLSRETKAGIVVSCSFLGLVGVVLFSKMNDKASMPVASDELAMQLPAEPTPHQEEAGRTPEPPLAKNGVVQAAAPGNLPLRDEGNLPRVSPAEEIKRKEQEIAKPSRGPAAPPPIEEPHLTVPGGDSAQRKAQPGNRSATENTVPPVPEIKTKIDKADTETGAGKMAVRAPVIPPPEVIKNDRADEHAHAKSDPADKSGAAAPTVPAFDTKTIVPEVPGLTGKPTDKQERTKKVEEAAAPGKSPSNNGVPNLEMPALPRLNSEPTPPAPTPSAAAGAPPAAASTVAPPAPPDLGAFDHPNANPAPTKPKETVPAPNFPTGSGSATPNTTTSPEQRPPLTMPPPPGSPTPAQEASVGLVTPGSSPATKPAGMDRGPAGTPPLEPPSRPLDPPAAPSTGPNQNIHLGRPEIGSASAPSPSSSPPAPSPSAFTGPASRAQPRTGATLADARSTGTPASLTSNEPQVESYDEETYVWQPNDSFRAISQDRYKSDKFERALLLFNRNHPLAKPGIKEEPPKLQPGQEIYIPPTRILEKYYAIGIAADSSPAPQPATAAPTPKPRTYQVQPGGEMFLDIARRALGNSERWSDIYRLNPRFDPSQPVPAGTELVLPQ